MANLLLCLQMSPIDALAAVDLAELIADIEDGQPCQCKPAWLVSYRKDTTVTRVHGVESQLCNYFGDVWVAQAREHGNGWPAGPNALWRSTMSDVYRLFEQGKIQAPGVLTFEADCVPMRVDWIDRLDEAYGKRVKPVLGNVHGDHINGNAIFPVTLAKDWPEMMQSPREIAWDYFHKDFLMENGEDTPFITQLYKRKQLTKPEWVGTKKSGERPALLHGIKDGTARAFAREELVHGRRIRKGTSAMTISGQSFKEERKGRMQGV